jgi:hypothetical protein
MAEQELRELLRTRREAYEQLVAGAQTLRAGRLFWTERALLGLVEAVASRRLEQLRALSATRGHGRGSWIDESDLGDSS